MRGRFILLLAGVLAAGALPASPELQNVQVGGKIRIRGNYYMNTYAGPAAAEVRWPASSLPARPIGGPFAAGGGNGLGVVSLSDWDNRGSDATYVAQRPRFLIVQQRQRGQKFSLQRLPSRNPARHTLGKVRVFE